MTPLTPDQQAVTPQVDSSFYDWLQQRHKSWKEHSGILICAWHAALEHALASQWTPFDADREETFPPYWRIVDATVQINEEIALSCIFFDDKNQWRLENGHAFPPEVPVLAWAHLRAPYQPAKGGA